MPHWSSQILPVSPVNMQHLHASDQKLDTAPGSLNHERDGGEKLGKHLFTPVRSAPGSFLAAEAFMTDPRAQAYENWRVRHTWCCSVSSRSVLVQQASCATLEILHQLACLIVWTARSKYRALKRHREIQ